MGILGMWTADLQDRYLPGLDLNYSTPLSNSYARTGEWSFEWDNWNTLNFSKKSSSFYSRMAVYHPATFGEHYYHVQSFPAVSDTHYDFRVNYTPAAITILDRNGVQDIISNIVAYHTWNLIEIYGYIHQTDGEIKVKWNDNLLYEGSGLDTQYHVDYSEAVLIRTYSEVDCYVDDIMIRDDDWCGLGGLHVLSPSGAGSTEDWTASSGNPEDCVDELPMTFDDYITTPGNTPNTEHLFGIESLPASSITIGGVAVFSKIKSDEVTDAGVRVIIDSNGTQGVGSGTLLQVTDSWATGYWEQNPDTAADWETADIEALEIGVETT